MKKILILLLIFSNNIIAQPICKGMLYQQENAIYNTLSTIYQSYNLGLPRFTITNSGRDYSCIAVNALCSSDIGKNTGKWFWELNAITGGATASYQFGLIQDRTLITGSPFQTVLVQQINNIGYRGQAGVNCYGYWYTSGSVTTCSNTNVAVSGCTSCTGGAVGNNVIWSFALDCDTGTFRVYKNGTLVSTVVNIPMTNKWYFTIQARTGASVSGSCNFGQSTFTYTPAALGLSGYPNVANQGGLYD